MPTKFATTIDMKGPFFTADIRKTVLQNKRDFMDIVAIEGERDVKAQLQAGEGGRQLLSHGIEPARVSGHVIGRTSNLSGKRWRATAVVSVYNRGWTRQQGIALMAGAANVERQTHAFRRTKGRLNRLGKKADLFKGLR